MICFSDEAFQTSSNILIKASLFPVHIGNPFLKMKHKSLEGITCILISVNWKMIQFISE
jgi:hypothetical protein